MKKFLAVLAARNKEFYRDTAALSWNILFPVIVIFGFAFAFKGSSQDVFKVGALGVEQSSPFQAVKYIQFVHYDDPAEALAKLKRHQLDMVIDEGATPSAPKRYWINSSSPKGYLLERILWGSGQTVKATRESVDGQEIRYVDWLISGLLGMNMMFSALFGVGYTIVRYRKNGVLKRLKATPLASFEFLSAQVVSRLILILLITTLVYFGTHAFIHFQMLGSYALLLLIFTLGAICLISLGLLMAARTSSEEFAGGILNLVSWPMMFLSGVWFSLEGANPWVKRFAQIFPLTHVIDSARAVMTEGAGMNTVYPHIIVLAVMSVVFLGVGSLTFKWE